MTISYDQTLDELDPPAWGPPDYDSHLVTRCHELRKVKLEDFTVEDLRLMIGQKIALEWLIPIALTKLEANPLAEGDMYEGDLLSAVIRAENTDEATHQRLNSIVKKIDPLEMPYSINNEWAGYLEKYAQQAGSSEPATRPAGL